MFVTIVEAGVAPDRESALRSAWDTTSHAAVPDGFIESSLLRAESGVWRIVTVWESREAVLRMREAGRPPAFVMFEQAGAEPALSTWTVEGRIRAT
jgi:heme-degrading monooxygenase HmoA